MASAPHMHYRHVCQAGARPQPSLCAAGWLAALVMVLAGMAEAVAAAPVQGSQTPQYLLVISIDGLAWDAFESRPTAMPTLAWMAKSGAAGPLTSVFPSMTWAAHASLWTGQLPVHHGVVGNRFYDRAKGKWVEYSEKGAEILRTSTLADAAFRQGKTVAALFWPNSGGAASIAWNVPEMYREKDFARTTTPASRALLDAIGLPGATLSRLASNESYTMDMASQEMAVRLIQEHKPQVLFVHLLSVDTAAHSYGPASAAATWAMTSADRNLAAILAAYDRAGIGSSLAAFVVSDHGFASVARTVYVPAVLQAVRAKAGVASLQLMANGHALYAYGLADKRALTAAAAALRATAGIERVVTTAEFAELGLATPTQDDRSPDLIALAATNVLLWNGREPSKDGAQHMYGTHGYLPTAPGLQGVLVARGPGVAVGRVTGARVIDVAPTAAVLLGLQLPGPVDGKVLGGVVAPAKPK